jgi:hypothetical protein
MRGGQAVRPDVDNGPSDRRPSAIPEGEVALARAEHRTRVKKGGVTVGSPDAQEVGTMPQFSSSIEKMVVISSGPAAPVRS